MTQRVQRERHRWTTGDLKRVRELRYDDGLSCSAVAELTGLNAGTITRYFPGRPGKIDNTALREAFLRSGLTAADVARRMGWVYGHGHKADATRVRRTLGTTTDRSHGRRSVRRWVDAETAGLLAEAIGVAPWEIGA